jgi:O-antigen ligase
MAAEGARLSLAHGLLLATVAMLPFGVGAELPVLAGSIAGLVALARGQIDWALPTTRLALMLGLAYWLPQFASALDSLASEKSWTEAALDLRFLPFLLWVAQPVREGQDAGRTLRTGIAAIAAIWCADALLQAATGLSLGGAATSDRLSGIFGAGNLKLGGVIAVLAPFALIAAWRRFPTWGLPVCFLALLVVVLLAGARAAWVGLALGSGLTLWHLLGGRRALLGLAAAIFLIALVSALGYVSSERFAQRLDRTAAALGGDHAGVEYALTGRLAIWDVAWRMGEDHPINGVGVRAFRHVYPRYADPDDAFVDVQTGQGASHAHQIVLELWSETGLVGLVCWLLAVWLGWRGWRRQAAAARKHAMPAAIALAVVLFPINTHYAVYSAFWGLLLIWLIGAWLALLAGAANPPGGAARPSR